jgi:N-acetylglutamate synthase-like GNAT family acetyltransferase
MVTATSPTSPRVCFSVARANDADGIARFLRRLSVASRRSAYLGTEPGLSVIARDRDAGVVVGQAVLVNAGGGVADIAVTVADAYDSHQIGAHLLERLMVEARRHDIGTLRADMLAHSHRIVDVFTWHGFAPVGSRMERLYLSLDSLDEATPRVEESESARA